MQNVSFHQPLARSFDITESLAGKDALAYCTRGAARCAIGRYEDAIEDFESAKQINPVCSRVYWLCAVAHDKMGSSQALENFKRAIELYKIEGDDRMAVSVSAQMERLAKK
jgi:tetratricopeptide (TPR) repeat protein